MKNSAIFLLVFVLALLAAPCRADDLMYGGIGVDVSLEKGRLVVSQPSEGMPAKAAGVKAGDEIVAVDGKPVDASSLDAATAPLAGPIGSTVAVTIRRKGSTLTEVLSIVRAPLPTSAVTFNPIPSQMNEGVFQISLFVHDRAGRPVPGARVTVYQDPAYSKAHILIITAQIHFRDASGTTVKEISGVTGEDGRATLWVRLGSNATPYRSRLIATVTVGQQTIGPIQSNVFGVYDPSTNN